MSDKNFEKIADDILRGVDCDIYKNDCNEMDNELRDEIESKLIAEFGRFDLMKCALSQVLELGVDEVRREIIEDAIG